MCVSVYRDRKSFSVVAIHVVHPMPVSIFVGITAIGRHPQWLLYPSLVPCLSVCAWDDQRLEYIHNGHSKPFEIIEPSVSAQSL